MELYSSDETYKLYQGNMLDMLEVIEENSIDSIVTDPPYELNFMGKDWDNSGIAFKQETWEKCLKVLKPGGHMLVFGGSRCFHRVACAIEDAGFELRDTILWLYGSGLSKSMSLGKSVESKVLYGSANKTEFKKLAGTKEESGNWGISKTSYDQGFRPADYTADKHLRTVDVDYKTDEGKEWDGWGTQLKPAFEVIILARKPCIGSITDNVLQYRVGGLNIDDCRIGHSEELKTTTRQPKDGAVFNTESSGWDNTQNHLASADPKGRFPANLILSYDDTDFDEVCGGFPQTVSSGGSGETSKQTSFGMYKGGWKHGMDCSHLGGLGDSGSAARYFYCAKASRRDRDDGIINGSNIHPTVKPVNLISYLVRLVTSKGGIVLDPFNGSGSTGKAIMWENRDRHKDYKYIGIDLSEEYLNISKQRIEYAKNSEYIAAEDERPKKPEGPGQVLDMFMDF